MSKEKLVFLCTNCGFDSPKWEGKCPSCKEWNTMKEYKVPKGKEKQKDSILYGNVNQPIQLESVSIENRKRIVVQDSELNRCLGGGMVEGGIILLAGEPGIGKSTLLLQTAANIPGKVLYISGEESAEQIKMRAIRMKASKQDLWLLSEVELSKIKQQITSVEPKVVILDSIQTTFNPHLDGEPGNISQLRNCTMELQRMAKEFHFTLFIIGHVTKEGSIAGPKILEHIVDTVLYFEGDKQYNYRLLRVNKNRFGSTDEIGIYQMDGKGLQVVEDPSKLFMSQSNADLSGCSTAITIEGGRPIMVEVQALVTPTVYAAPQRSATGFDLRRLSMLIAVLEKRCGFPLGKCDVFVNIAGGIKVNDPGIDVAVIIALMSSFRDYSVSKKICFAAEIGLTGELRSIHRFEQRVKEADRLQFEQIICSDNNGNIADNGSGIVITPVATVQELLEYLFQ
ncbi:DNA repair protein RadA [Membranihabitans marinus]|uniref:DNA repair protein RadA n=1 Tax=Membranihabitans marinus TaxID=1227546 RepID=UPI001F011402|nr:DNA repair protein RadA [Membranihabitans marinus]